jgi:serine/threonine protein kinase
VYDHRVTAGAAEQFGPYVVFEEIGVGGMASVHRAESRGVEGFSRSVALKRMLPHCAVSTDFVQAFVREARIASHLRHINVAQTYELGKVGDIYFIAMELVAGKNLRQVLRHCAQMTGPMPVAVTLNILNQICDALDYAHNLCDESGQPLGIIHRDVSPSNILVSDEGIVKLIDFGIAKASAAGMQTTSGMLKGKFGYMAPEYIAGSIDARADLFAVGVIAHELLTNRPLFTASDDMDTLQRVRNMVIKPPSARNEKVPPEVDDIVMTALARDPDRRWQNATALHTAMNTVTKRLKLACSNTEVSKWIEWAFRQHKALTFDAGEESTTGMRAEAAQTTMDPRVEDRTEDNRSTVRQKGNRGSGPALAYPPSGSNPPATMAAQTAVVLARPSPNPAVARVPPMPAMPLSRPPLPPASSALITTPALVATPQGAPQPAAQPATTRAMPQHLTAPRRPSAQDFKATPPAGVPPLLAQIAQADAVRAAAPRRRTEPPRGNATLVVVTVFVLLVAAAVTYCVLTLS